MKAEDKPKFISELREIILKIDIEKLIKQPDNAFINQGIYRAKAIFTNFDYGTGEKLQLLINNLQESYQLGDTNQIRHIASDLKNWIIQKTEEMDVYKIDNDDTDIKGSSGDLENLKKIFIGHGKSPLWRELKDFILERLHLEWDEFNREATAGLSTKERLLQMLTEAELAFLVMTAEDEHTDGSIHARENIIHEAGLFQGKLGFEKAIILLEEGCEEFSNIHGITQIRFHKGSISSCFEEIRRILERENLLGKDMNPNR